MLRSSTMLEQMEQHVFLKTMRFCGNHCSENGNVEIHIFTEHCICLVLIHLGGSWTCMTKGFGDQSVWRYSGRRWNFTALRGRLLSGFAPNCPLAPAPACRHCNNSVAWPWLLSNINTCVVFQRKRELIMSEAEEYEVETIVSKRLRKGKLLGLVQVIS